jgi:hypothetical protein
VGAAQERDVSKLFGWQRELITRTMNTLAEKGKLVEAEHPKEKGQWFALIRLI